MAGDWIKARVSLHDQPEVLGLARRVGIDVDSVVGKLLRVWSWADGVTKDGRIEHVDETDVDRIARQDGFAAAMIAVDWLVAGDSGVTIPKFDRHNGKSAKRRA